MQSGAFEKLYGTNRAAIYKLNAGAAGEVRAGL